MILSFYRIEIQGPQRKSLFIKEKSRSGRWREGGRRVGEPGLSLEAKAPPKIYGFHIFWDTKGLQKVLADASVFLKALDNLHYPS